jgi:FdhD protein
MPSERKTGLYVNGMELLSIQTTPVHLDDWAVGFLYTEGIIGRLADLRLLEVDPEALTVTAEIDPALLSAQELTGKRYLTSACGKGVTFSSVKDAMQLQPVRPGVAVTRLQLSTWIKQMQRETPLYASTGGMHAAAVLHVPSETLLVREDIGRHNAADKVVGAALKAGWPSEELVLLTTGRISYEMCAKLGRTGIGIGASLTAATDQAIRLAQQLSVDLAGYVKSPEKLIVYTASHRIG